MSTNMQTHFAVYTNVFDILLKSYKSTRRTEAEEKSLVRKTKMDKLLKVLITPLKCDKSISRAIPGGKFWACIELAIFLCKKNLVGYSK